MYPNVNVDVDGVPVSGLFFDRLVSLTIQDREGIRADTLKLVFSDGPPRFFSSPRRGAVVNVKISMGFGGGFEGAYVIDRVQFACLPYTITVSGHSADMQADMKTNKTRHWDDTSVKEIVAEIASDHQLEAKIADVVSGHVYEWIGQQDETDLSFLGRLASKHGALFTIKNGALLWLERGTGKTASGDAVPVAQILLPSLVTGSFRMTESDVNRFKSVKAYWQDRAGAKRQEIVIEADPEATGEKVLRDPLSSKEEAEKSARAAVREMLQGKVDVSCAVVGRPSLMAGQPVAFTGVRPGVDGREFIMESVQHTFAKGSGLRTTISGKLKADA